MTFPAGWPSPPSRACPWSSTSKHRVRPLRAQVDQRIYDIERRGMHGAIKIIAVTISTKKPHHHHYGIDPAKWKWFTTPSNPTATATTLTKRLTASTPMKRSFYSSPNHHAESPEYFLAAAKKGAGGDGQREVRMAAARHDPPHHRDGRPTWASGTKSCLLVPPRRRRGKSLKMADLYVMPSVLRTFGIAPLEPMKPRRPCHHLQAIRRLRS